jgi:hypothetical protein
MFGIFLFVLVPFVTTNKILQNADENRELAKAPHFPGIFADGCEFSVFNRDIESWLNDHIGLRKGFVWLYGQLHINILHTSPHRQLLFGENGHTFLASHANGNSSFNSFTKEVLSIPKPDKEQIQKAADAIIEAKSLSNIYGVPVVAVFIPQKQLLDFENLPYYIRKFVELETLETPFELKIKNVLPAPIQDWIIYPYQEASMQNKLHPLYPKNNFHWVSGQFTAIVAAKIAEHFGIAAYQAPNDADYAESEQRSDMSYMAGCKIVDKNYFAYKPNVLSDIGISQKDLYEYYDSLKHIYSAAYYRNEKSANKYKILWLGDSFSSAIAGDLARYYGETLCIDAFSTTVYANSEGINLNAEMRQLLTIYQPDYIVLSRHTLTPQFLDFLKPILPMP